MPKAGDCGCGRSSVRDREKMVERQTKAAEDARRRAENRAAKLSEYRKKRNPA